MTLVVYLGDSGMSGDPMTILHARISCRPSDTLQPNDNHPTPIFTRAAVFRGEKNGLIVCVATGQD